MTTEALGTNVGKYVGKFVGRGVGFAKDGLLHIQS